MVALLVAVPAVRGDEGQGFRIRRDVHMDGEGAAVHLADIAPVGLFAVDLHHKFAGALFFLVVVIAVVNTDHRFKRFGSHVFDRIGQAGRRMDADALFVDDMAAVAIPELDGVFIQALVLLGFPPSGCHVRPLQVAEVDDALLLFHQHLAGLRSNIQRGPLRKRDGCAGSGHLHSQ